MIKINLTQKIFNLKGTPYKDSDGKEDLTVGTVLANTILAPQKTKKGFRPLRAWELAQKFSKNEEVEIDSSDLVQIKEILEESEDYFPITRAQVLEAIIKAESGTK